MTIPEAGRGAATASPRTAPAHPSQVIKRPVTQAEIDNPREFQLGQLRRRYSPDENVDKNGTGTTVLSFRLSPSDPDFPFELDALECELRIPQAYLSRTRNDVRGNSNTNAIEEIDNGIARPWLRVKNKSMGRGYQINVEKGFDSLVLEYPNASLLTLVKMLDRNLEAFLAAPKADTIKLVSHTTKEQSNPAGVERKDSRTAKAAGINAEAPSFVPAKAQKSPSETELASARERRTKEVRQLEARLGRSPLFKKSDDGDDGTCFTVPAEPRALESLPAVLQGVKTIKLHVPLRYPVEPCWVELLGIEESAKERKAVERAFAEKARMSARMSLTGLVNYLVENMHLMATAVTTSNDTITTSEESLRDGEREKNPATPQNMGGGGEPRARANAKEDAESEKSHVRFIQRPPEWDTRSDEESSGSGSDLSDSDTSDEELEGEEEEEDDDDKKIQATPSGTDTSERGISIAFPNLEMLGVELLELYSLSITVKCQRCKEVADVKDLKSYAATAEAGMRSVTCKKCSGLLRIGQYP